VQALSLISHGEINLLSFFPENTGASLKHLLLEMNVLVKNSFMDDLDLILEKGMVTCCGTSDLHSCILHSPALF